MTSVLGASASPLDVALRIAMCQGRIFCYQIPASETTTMMRGLSYVP